ncbi:MAG: caspase family protein [Hyphomonadaceae bacterium]
MTQTSQTKAVDRDRFEPAEERGLILPFDFDPARYVFISHVRETDPDLLRAIVRSLLRRRVSIWIYDPTPCRLSDEEDRAVQSQEEDQDERPGTPWQTLVTDAIDKASSVLMIIGKRSRDNQTFEIDHAVQKESRHAIRIDDVPDADIPDKLREGVIRKLDVTSQPPEVIAAAVQRLADRIARDVLGDDFKPPPKAAPASDSQPFFKGRTGLIAAAAIAVVAVGGLAVSQFLPKASSTEQPVIDATAVPVTGPRLALVITQTEYNDTSIRRVDQAEEEGNLIEGALDTLEFKITRVRNKSKDDLEKALGDFRKTLAAAGNEAVGFIYYTGHGVQDPHGADNFLLGTDAELAAEGDIQKFGVSLTAQRDFFRSVGAKGVFLVFDACRNVPPEVKAVGAPKGYEPPTKGLARIDVPRGMLVAYATDSGEFAREGVYAPVLAEELVKQQRVEQAFLNTKDRVAQKSGHKQLPWNDSKVYGLCFNCPPRS